MVCVVIISISITNTNGAEDNNKDSTEIFEIDFDPRPSYIPNNVVVLTFDDGPDHANTEKCLDVLAEKNESATFFINTENFVNVNHDEAMQRIVRRMAEEGHTIGSHTAEHLHLSWLTEEKIETQLSNVEETVNNIFGNNAPRLTLVRAPFGEPYQTNHPLYPNKDYELVAPIVARHAVHIGWAIDSHDYNCANGDSKCVFYNIKRALGSKPGHGSYGIILMHSVHSQTCKALGPIIDYIRKRGFKIWSTEQLVEARFGYTSEQLIYGEESNELSKKSILKN